MSISAAPYSSTSYSPDCIKAINFGNFSNANFEEITKTTCSTEDSAKLIIFALSQEKMHADLSANKYKNSKTLFTVAEIAVGAFAILGAISALTLGNFLLPLAGSCVAIEAALLLSSHYLKSQAAVHTAKKMNYSKIAEETCKPLQNNEDKTPSAGKVILVSISALGVIGVFLGNIYITSAMTLMNSLWWGVIALRMKSL